MLRQNLPFALILEDDAELSSKAVAKVLGPLANASLPRAVHAAVRPDVAMVEVGTCWNIRPHQHKSADRSKSGTGSVMTSPPPSF